MSIPISYQEDDDDSNELIQPLRSAPDGTISGTFSLAKCEGG